MRMQSAECVCTELCVCLLLCYRLCEIIFLCRIYWVEVVGMERKSILNSFFPFENVKIPELRIKPAAFLGMGEKKHSFCLFLTSKRKFMGFDYLRGMRLLNQTFQQHLGWQLHCVLLSLDWWFWTLTFWWAGPNPSMTSPAMNFWPGLKFPLCKVHVKFI